MEARGNVHSFVPLSEKLKSPSDVQPECCIFKIHNHLWEIRGTAYKPQIVAIGPYHRSSSKNSSSSSSSSEKERKVKFSMMEVHKLRYLNKILEHKGVDVGSFIKAIRSEVGKVRNFYAEPLSFMSDDELAEIMVLDGCFIIELVRKKHMKHLQERDDPIFKMDWMMNSLQRDLMLFENQLPFFVLHKLFGMIERPNDTRLVQLVLKFFDKILPDPREHKWDPNEHSLDQVRHLVELIHLRWHSDIMNEIMDTEDLDTEGSRFMCCTGTKRSDSSGEMRFIMRCATELREAGVEFEKFDEGKSLFDIRFRKGTLQIPTLIIEDRTEAFFRNLIAYEQYWDRDSRENRPSFVTDYVCFMDSLINTPKDVEILCRQGIIDNLLGDDEAVCEVFNKIADSVIVARNNSRYYGIEKKVNFHCEKSWNRWMAMLRHNHFDSPWGITSVVAGIILLILTLAQTYFTVFPR